MSSKDSDLNKIKNLVKIMKQNDLVEVEISDGGEKILLKRSVPSQQQITALPMMPHLISDSQVQAGSGSVLCSGDSAALKVDDGLIEIKSPIVGTFYAKPSPDADPFVDVGSNVSSQTVVCIVEAMKVMNEIKADTSGRIEQVLVKNGQAVEFGQVLFKVKPE